MKCGVLATLLGALLCLFACDNAPNTFVFTVGMAHMIIGLWLVSDEVKRRDQVRARVRALNGRAW